MFEKIRHVDKRGMKLAMGAVELCEFPSTIGIVVKCVYICNDVCIVQEEVSLYRSHSSTEILGVLFLAKFRLYIIIAE